MSLHSEIMKIGRDYEKACEDFELPYDAYTAGHRDARYAAAELANAADSRIELLESALKAAKQYVIQTDDFGRSYSDDVLKIINEALGGQQ